MKKNKNQKPKSLPKPRPKRREKSEAVLRFTPYAWAKLQWFCHRGETEIGGFGIAPGDDLLLIEDFITVKQDVSVVSVSFDDEAVADHFDRQVDQGRRPEQFSRLWLHTHPGESPEPSGVDEETFQRVFGDCDWAVMFILAQHGKTYARLRFNVGPRGDCVIPVELDCSRDFPASDHGAWEAEYAANIHAQSIVATHVGLDMSDADPKWFNEFELDQLDELEQRAMAGDPEAYEELFLQENEVIE